jgi:hypothetical protein
MLIKLQGKRIVSEHKGQRILGGSVWRLNPGSRIATRVGKVTGQVMTGQGFLPPQQYSQQASNLGFDVNKVRYPRHIRGGSVSRNNIRLVI